MNKDKNIRPPGCVEPTPLCLKMDAVGADGPAGNGVKTHRQGFIKLLGKEVKANLAVSLINGRNGHDIGCAQFFCGGNNPRLAPGFTLVA